RGGVVLFPHEGMTLEKRRDKRSHPGGEGNGARLRPGCPPHPDRTERTHLPPRYRQLLWRLRLQSADTREDCCSESGSSKGRFLYEIFNRGGHRQNTQEMR